MQLTAILAEYRAEIIEYVTAPQTGIQRKLKFKPTLAEIVEACDAQAWHLDLANRPKPVAALPRQRDQFRQNYNELVERYGRPVGVFDRDREFPYG